MIIVNHANSREFWLDEILTYQRIQLSVHQLAKTVYWQGAHSPLYFVLLKFFVQITGASLEPGGRAEFILRLPSAILITGAGALLIHALIRLGRPNAGLVLGLLWLSWPLLLHYANEARPYALLVFFTALAIWGTLIFFNGAGEQRALWASAVGSVGLALSMPLGIIVAVTVEVGALLAFSAQRKPLWRQRCMVVWPLLGGAALAYLPAVIYKAADYWTSKIEITRLSWVNTGRALLGIYSPNGIYGAAMPDDRLLPRLLAWLPLLFLTGYVIASHLRSRAPTQANALFLAFGALAIPGVLCLASLHTSVLVNRYFVPTLCFTLPLYASWIAWQPKRLGKLLAVLALTSTFASGWMFYTKPDENNYSQIKIIFKKHDIDRVVFFVDNFIHVPSMQVYLRNIASDIYYEPKPGLPPIPFPSVHSGRPDPNTSFWMIQSKKEFEAAGRRIAWADADRQCSIALSTYVMTLVTPDPEQLKLFANECIGSGDPIPPTDSSG
jgi:hypothetical protein